MWQLWPRRTFPPPPPNSKNLSLAQFVLINLSVCVESHERGCEGVEGEKAETAVADA